MFQNNSRLFFPRIDFRSVSPLRASELAAPSCSHSLMTEVLADAIFGERQHHPEKPLDHPRRSPQQVIVHVRRLSDEALRAAEERAARAESELRASQRRAEHLDFWHSLDSRLFVRSAALRKAQLAHEQRKAPTPRFWPRPASARGASGRRSGGKEFVATARAHYAKGATHRIYSPARRPVSHRESVERSRTAFRTARPPKSRPHSPTSPPRTLPCDRTRTVCGSPHSSTSSSFPAANQGGASSDVPDKRGCRCTYVLRTVAAPGDATAASTRIHASARQAPSDVVDRSASPSEVPARLLPAGQSRGHEQPGLQQATSLRGTAAATTTSTSTNLWTPSGMRPRRPMTAGALRTQTSPRAQPRRAWWPDQPWWGCGHDAAAAKAHSTVRAAHVDIAWRVQSRPTSASPRSSCSCSSGGGGAGGGAWVYCGDSESETGRIGTSSGHSSVRGASADAALAAIGYRYEGRFDLRMMAP
jgi:hypothetical protein